MKFLIPMATIAALGAIMMLTACNGDDPPVVGCEGVDCGADCLPCHCYNQVKDGNETCIDCGGDCDDCDLPTGRYVDLIFPSYVSMSSAETRDLGTEYVYGNNVFPSGLEQDLTLTFFAPGSDTESRRPIILILGGSGYGTGWATDTEELNMDFIFQHNYVADFLGKGYVVALVNTRYIDPGSTNTLEDQYDVTMKARADLLAAVRFFRQGAATYGIDTDNIWLLGYSGGASIALHAALLGSDDANVLPDDMMAHIDNNGGFEGNSGNPGVSSAVKGIINMCGFVFENAYVNDNDQVHVYSLMPSTYDQDRFAMECETIGSDYFDDQFQACGPRSFDDLEDHEIEILTGLDQWTMMEPDGCTDCPNKITNYISQRLGDCPGE